MRKIEEKFIDLFAVFIGVISGITLGFVLFIIIKSMLT